MADNLLHTVHAGLPYSRPNTPGGHVSQIGFVGIGNMGYFMARNLARRRTAPGLHTPPLLVWNRTPSKAQKLAQEFDQDRLQIATSLEHIATECDIIITNLVNDAVVKSVYEEFANILKNSPPTRNKIFVETSTIFPHLSGELDTLISSIPHSHLITCPVVGAPAAADKAQLLIIMAGDYRSKKEIAYLFVPAVGRKVVDLGENLEKAPTFKLLVNSMVLGTVEVMSEAYTLGAKAGIESERVHEFIKDLFPAPGIVACSERLLHDGFDGSTGFALEGGIKDVSHIRHLTATYDSPMPVMDITHQHLITARAIHAAQKQAGTAVFDTLDWSALVAGSRVAAGLDAFDSTKHDTLVVEENE